MSDTRETYTAEDGLVHPSVDEAIAAVRRCSFMTEEGREITHCLAGGFGADWDTEDAIEAVRNSTDRAWLDHILSRGECLAIIVEGRKRVFDLVLLEPAE